MLFDHLPSLTVTWMLALTAAAALTDTRRGLIPNWLTLPTLTLAPCAQLLCFGALGAANALGGVLACGLVPLAMFGMRAIGGGDVKLFAALGALCGASLGLELQLASYAIAAVVGLAAAARNGLLAPLLSRALRLLWPKRPSSLASTTGPALSSVRLGIPIFAAAVLLCAVHLVGAR